MATNTILPLLALAIVSTFSFSHALEPCPPCGGMEVPYPLSTSQGCGNPNYVLHCENDVLKFPSLGGTHYTVLSVNPSASRLIISPPSIEPGTCHSSDLMEGGLRLDESSPFNITTRNTVMLFNCPSTILLSPLNCSSSSLCRRFEDVEGGSGCGNKLCCTYLKDSSMNVHRIRVRVEGCTAYTSVVDIDSNAPPSLWNYGVELQWIAPTTL